MQADSGMLLNSVRDILYVIFRHKGKIVLFFLLTAVVVTAVTFMLPVAYQSDALLLIRLGRENLPGDPSMRDTWLNVTQDRTSEVKSEMAILESHYLAERVVDAMGEGWILDRPGLRREVLPIPEPSAPTLLRKLMRDAQDMAKSLLVTLYLMDQLTPYEDAVRRVMKNLEVEYEKQTNIIQVRYLDKHAPLAQVVLDTLVKFYLERHVEVFALQVSPEFLERQVLRMRDELTEREEDLDLFRNKHGIASIQAQKETLLQQISVLEGELSDSTAAAKGLQAQVDALLVEVGKRPDRLELQRTVGMPNYVADWMKERLGELRLEETNLSARYNDNHRPLIELREQISKLEAALAGEEDVRTEITSGLDSTREGLLHTYHNERANLEGFMARIEKLKEEVARHKGTLAELGAQEKDLERLTRNKELAEAEYRKYRENLEMARISAAMAIDNVTNVSVVQPASKPLLPVKPRKIRTICLGLLVGLFGGICLAFVREYFDDSLNTTEAVEKRLGVPVLASISEKEFRACT